MLMLLVRHASTDDAGVRLSGRQPGVRLSGAGRREAHELAARLAPLAPTAIYASPLERALETAAPIARACALKITIEPELVEIDFGEWTGARFDVLDGDAAWQLFNDQPGRARIPAGERLADVATRAARVIRRIALRHEGPVIAVSHLDVLRLGIARLTGRPIDAFRCCEIAPASVFTMQFSGGHVAAENGVPFEAAGRRRAS